MSSEFGRFVTPRPPFYSGLVAGADDDNPWALQESLQDWLSDGRLLNVGFSQNVRQSLLRDVPPDAFVFLLGSDLDGEKFALAYALWTPELGAGGDWVSVKPICYRIRRAYQRRDGAGVFLGEPTVDIKYGPPAPSRGNQVSYSIGLIRAAVEQQYRDGWQDISPGDFHALLRIEIDPEREAELQARVKSVLAESQSSDFSVL